MNFYPIVIGFGRSRSAIGIILLSVCPSVCDAVHCGYMIHLTPEVSEEVNRKWPQGTQF